jgi:HEAT repeat protein
MGIFSNYAIKQALPQFLKELENDNWRSKFSTVEALGNMAFCAPKQISTFLPQIVKVLREVLNDTHEKVHNAAIEAIKKIGSVIKCPEIGDMLECIIKALANTNTHLNEALNLILETSFAHAIDAPSLSLLVPLLDAGLVAHDNKSK